MLRVGIAGLGHWGPNLGRVFDNLEECRVTAICEQSFDRLEQYQKVFSRATATRSIDDVLSADVLDAIVIATPTKTHFSLAKRALERGIHTFVEKPLAMTAGECRELTHLAADVGAILFVGHVYLHSEPIKKLRALVDEGEFGQLNYIHSSRLNLGPVRHDVNALWDLAPHDVAIMLELMGERPVSVSCSGAAFLNASVEDVCSITLRFPSGGMGFINVSWLEPCKRRSMTIVGNRKMAVFDDMEPLEKIKVYDRGVDITEKSQKGRNYSVDYRHGESYSPALSNVEPLRLECEEFVRSVVSGVRPTTDGHNGMDVVCVLEAAQSSLRQGGGEVVLRSAWTNESGPSTPGINGNSVRRRSGSDTENGLRPGMT